MPSPAYEALLNLLEDKPAGEVFTNVSVRDGLPKDQQKLLGVALKTAEKLGLLTVVDGASKIKKYERTTNAYRILPKGKGAAIVEKSPLTGTGFRAATVRTLEALQETVEYFLQFDEFVFDVETRGTRPSRGKNDIPALDPMTNDVVWISIAGPGRCEVIPCGHPTGPEQLTKAEVFEALRPLFFSDRRKVNQNVKFDLLSIAKYYDDVIPPGPYGETSVLIFLLNENLPNYDLGSLIERYYGYHYRKVAREGKDITEYPFAEIALYSYLDSKWTYLLWRSKYEVILRKPKLSALFTLEMDLLEVLAKMQQHGALVDRSGFERLDREIEPKLAVIEEKIYAAAGRRFLITSQQQKAKLLYGPKEEDGLGLPCLEVTKGGSQSVSESALRPLANKHPVVKLLLEHADLKKLHSTYVVGFQQHIHDDGRIRTTFNQRGAKTGRFSSSGPNLQNIPRQAG